MGETVRFGVSLDLDLLDQFDALIRRMGYDNRSEAVRDLIRDKLVQEEWETPAGDTFGVVFLLYDHEAMSLDSRLTDLEHRFLKNVVSSLHVHLDERNCLEVVVLRGTGKQVRSMGEKLVSVRGVKYGKLSMGLAGR